MSKKGHKQMDHVSKGFAKHLDELRKRQKQREAAKKDRGARGGGRR